MLNNVHKTVEKYCPKDKEYKTLSVEYVPYRASQSSITTGTPNSFTCDTYATCSYCNGDYNKCPFMYEQEIL